MRAAQLMPHAPDDVRVPVAVLIHRLARAWFPGNVSGDDLEALPLLSPKRLDALDLSRDDWLVLRPMTEAGMLRSTVMGITRANPSKGHSAAHRYGAYLNDFVRLAREHGMDRYADRLTCLHAEILGLAGLAEEAIHLAGEVLTRSIRAGDHSMSAHAHLLIGDVHAAPGSSPEILGLDLGDLNRPQVIVPSARARDHALASYRAARESFLRAGAPRGLAAVLVREAFLERCAGRPGSARELLDEAERRNAEAGDIAGGYLARVHRLLAEIDEGSFVTARTELAGELGRWAATAGSPSLVLGLSRLIRAAGRMWRRDGDAERARACLILAVDIAVVIGDTTEERSGLSDLGDLYASLNNRRPTLVLLERAIDRRLRDLGGWNALQGADFLLWCEIADLTVAQSAQYLELRDAGGLRICGDRMLHLITHRPEARGERLVVRNPFSHGHLAMRELERLGLDMVTEAGEPAPTESVAPRMIALLATTLATQVTMIRCMAPLVEAKQLRRDGSAAQAARLAEEAISLARGLGPAGRPYAAIALCWAGRFGEARDEIHALASETAELPPARHAELLVAARAYREARTLLLHHGQHPSFAQMPPRRRHIMTAQIALGHCEGNDALTLDVLGQLGKDIDEFERRFARLGRDAYRTSVCDDVEVGEMYFLAARLAVAAGATELGHEYGGRLRALPLQDALEDLAAIKNAPPTQAKVLLWWQQANVGWTAAFEQVAALGPAASAPPVLREQAAQSPARASAVAVAQQRLDASQAALERTERSAIEAVPGVLLRTQRATRIGPQANRPRPLPLPRDTMLLDYLVGADRTLLWARSRDRVHAWEIEADGDELAGLVQRATRSLAGEPREEDGRGAEEELAALLLGPARSMIEDHERVLLAPSGMLALVPFGALEVRPGTPLIAEHTVSYLPGAGLLADLSSSWRPAPEGAALVVGNPLFAPNRRLPRLKGAGVEAYHVARLLGVPPLQDGDATAANVRERLPGARILHLATHGRISPQAPTASAIALAGEDELTMSDLAGLALDADLVVLSACDTGRGEPTFGGELVGFTRALLATGARRVLVSLWPVNDLATCVFMENFHRRLVGGDSPAQALSRSQRWMRDEPMAGITVRYKQLRAAALRTPGDRPSARSHASAAAPDRGGSEKARLWAPFILVGSSS
ncbi:CHAT domain-containing tetratricopeptide repeat protein [Nonomuraea fuscirosea]|uniref:CHAT domain-containing tetratricopeptide repeat protein n=1 Tax=Nonomuraea fuscirosea TaxID=1291556 RepID=UPI0033F3DE2F